MKTTKLSADQLKNLGGRLTSRPDDLSRQRAEFSKRREEELNVEREKKGDRSDRRNQDIINALNIRHITVQSELSGPDLERIWKAVWNNGSDPLEIHILDARDERSALLEAEGVLLKEELPETDRSFDGRHDTASNKLPGTVTDTPNPANPHSAEGQDQIGAARVAVGQTPEGKPVASAEPHS